MVVDRKISQLCPICTGKRVLQGFNDLATTHPALAEEWHPTENGKLSFFQVNAGSNKKVWWQGKCGHEWDAVIASRALNGSGCSACTHRVSKAEHQIREFLEGLKLEVIPSDRKILGARREIDLWIPEKKVGIEFNGVYWHSEKWKERSHHYDKWVSARKVGIQLIQIWESDWIQDSEKVLQSLASKLVETPETRPVEKVVLNAKQATEFLQVGTLESKSEIHYIGMLDRFNELQSVMVLEPESENDEVVTLIDFTANSNFEYCFREGLKYVIATFAPSLIRTMTDNCHGLEDFYENNGFIAESVSPPDYMYLKPQALAPKSDYSMERFRHDPELKWGEGLSEMQLADINKLIRVWDAGKTNYVLSLK